MPADADRLPNAASIRKFHVLLSLTTAAAAQMYLRIASSPDLVDYLYHVLLDEAEVVHPLRPIRIVQARGRFFFVSDEPVGVGGPFSTIAELIRSEGQRAKLDAGVDHRPPAARVGRWTCFERQWRLNGDQAELEQLDVG